LAVVLRVDFFVVLRAALRTVFFADFFEVLAAMA
jgi:hypothetical protein